MSTKIYNGFKLKTNDMEEIHAFMSDMRQRCVPMVKEKMAHYFMQSVVHSIDFDSIHPSKVKFSPYQRAFDTFEKEQRKVVVNNVKDPTVDFSFSVCLFPHKGTFYGIYYTLQEDFVDMLISSDLFESYAYQNSTDKPDNVSDEEWAEREVVWGDIFDKQPIPSLNGFVYEIVLNETYDYPKVQEVVSCCISHDERVMNMAKNEMYAKFTKNTKFSVNNVVKVLEKWNEFFESEEGQNEFRTTIEYFKPLIKKVITQEMVIGK